MGEQAGGGLSACAEDGLRTIHARVTTGQPVILIIVIRQGSSKFFAKIDKFENCLNRIYRPTYLLSNFPKTERACIQLLLA